MQPNYSNIRKRIDNLPVTAELKADLIDGIETCQQFTVRVFLCSHFFCSSECIKLVIADHCGILIVCHFLLIELYSHKDI